MGMIDWPLYLACLSALAIGFALGYRYTKQSDKNSPSRIDGHYFKGLNFLLNEQPDAAIDSFISALEVNSETLETHLALGKLLRKRGEVDRAIRIHQNLLARPGLTLLQAQQAQYELATDFAKSGLFDRAEGLLSELVSKDGPYKVKGLERLLEVYRDEKEWEQGLEVLQKLSGSRLSRSYDDWAHIRAHFCCELAEEGIQSKQYKEVRIWLKLALSYDKQHVRAGLLLGRLEIATGNAVKGIIQLRKLVDQRSDYISEAIPCLTDAYQQLGDIEGYRSLLATLDDRHTSVFLAMSDVIERQDGHLAAAEYIAQKVVDQPSDLGLHKLLDYYLSFSEGKAHDYLSSLKVVMDQLVSNTVFYQCKHCGFSGKQLHWLCPSCKTWGSLKPRKRSKV